LEQQIRVHMLSIGHALVGDGKYNPTKRAQRQSKWCPRLFLHAQRLQFEGLPGSSSSGGSGGGGGGANNEATTAVRPTGDLGEVVVDASTGAAAATEGTAGVEEGVVVDVSVPLPPDLTQVLEGMSEVEAATVPED
jgi:hypothetical protein